MFLIKKPSPEQIREFIARQRECPFSYPEVGGSRQGPPSGYVVDHNRVKLGEGNEAFERARDAVRRWTMFRLGWAQVCWPDAPIEVGSTVAVLARRCGPWSLNACRIVYVVETEGAIEQFGFAYGTLPDHLEKGEERFTVEWRHEDDSVWYDILAFSRPNHVVARLGYPYVRRLQKQFVTDSKRAMIRAVSGDEGRVARGVGPAGPRELH